MYLLIGLTPEHVTKLKEAGIPLSEGKTADLSGYLVEDGYVRRVLSLTSAHYYDEAYREVMVNGREQSVQVLWFEFDGQRVTVDQGRWDGNGSKSWKQAAREILMPVVKKNIEISVPHGYTRNFDDLPSDTFSILAWSSPEGDPGVSVPSTAWGIRTQISDRAFAPVGTGEAIMTDEGWAIAELFPDALYIHYDLCHRGSYEEISILKRIFQEVAKLLSEPTEERLAKREKFVKDRMDKFRQAYVALCDGRHRKLIESTELAIKQGEMKVKDLQEKLVRAIRELRGSSKKLEQLKGGNSGLPEKYAQEFDKLHTIKKVRFVEAGNGTVKVFTDTLYCIDPRTRKRHEIGAFRIDIHVDGLNNGIRWFNLSRRVDGYKPRMNAPHIHPDGSACLGNSAEIFAELIGNYEFAMAAMVAIQFVESVNVDDAGGKYINSWPEAPEEPKPAAVPAAA